MIYDSIIVGAGLSALGFFKNYKKDNVLFLDKARNEGGRLAYRRVGGEEINTGAIETNWDEFEKDQVLKKLIYSENTHHLTIREAFKKAKIQRSHRVSKIRKDRKCFQVEGKGFSFEAENVILTCPLPQALELLNESNTDRLEIEEDLNVLEDITYKKEIILTFETKIKNFSLRNWNLKSQVNGSYLFYADDDYIANYFELPKEELTSEAQDTLDQQNITYDDLYLHKWRYSTCLNPLHEDYIKIGSGLYLIGDGIGDGSAYGAFNSGKVLAETLNGIFDD